MTGRLEEIDGGAAGAAHRVAPAVFQCAGIHGPGLLTGSGFDEAHSMRGADRESKLLMNWLFFQIQSR
jgi:hypothetical protein